MPRLLALSVHEFRTPISVAAGYVRMLLGDRAGAVTEQQRRMLLETEKSCARLSALVAEMSDLANLEAGTATVNRKPLDLRPLLAEAIAALPEMTDREMDVELATGEGPAIIEGDATRLKTTLTSIFYALRRELVTSTRLLVRERADNYLGRPASWIAIGDGDHIEALQASAPETLAVFDEWRGGCGLSLAVGRRVLDSHGGSVWSPADGSKAGAVVVLPHQG
ncbi:MAG: histidine kinase dimerization/phospho-acceptor domain-containing protein [Acidobacteriota bacterium]